MTFHESLSLVAFNAFVTLPTLSHFISPCNIFSGCFPLSFQLPQDVFISLFSSHGQKRLLGVYVFYLWMILLCGVLATPFPWISLQSMSWWKPRSVKFKLKKYILLKLFEFSFQIYDAFTHLKHLQLSPNNSNPDSSNSWIFRSRLILPHISLFKLYKKNIGYSEFWNKDPINSKRYCRDFFYSDTVKALFQACKTKLCSARQMIMVCVCVPTYVN